jgi:lipase chaperone LimK
MAKKKEYQVSIGYKAVIQVTVKSEDAEKAKLDALDYFRQYEHFGNKSEILDSNFGADGVVDMDATWNMVQS